MKHCQQHASPSSTARRYRSADEARGGRVAAALGLVLMASALASVPARAQSCGSGQTSVVFGFTGSTQTFAVPLGVHSVTVTLSGAQGGAGLSGAGTIGGSPNSPGGVGGLGGRVRGTRAVTPGTTLLIGVGGQGSQAVNAGGLGFSGSGTGGGATNLRSGIGDLAIAGGGGGGGSAGWSSSVVAGGAGGSGGGGSGGSGTAVPGGPGPFGGGGGSVGNGGVGGTGCANFPATAGNAVTGKGGNSNNFSGSFAGAGYGGGGGGGATIGGGGGGGGTGTTSCQQNWNGGGGGGSGGTSAATGLTSVSITNNVQTGNGSALICFVPDPIVLSLGVNSGREYVRAGQVISHLIEVGNAGSQNAVGVSIASTLPAELDASTLSWICVASTGSSCGATTSGTGNLPTSVNIAAGGDVSFVLNGTVLPGPTDQLTVQIAVTRPAGSAGSNASATRTTKVVVFRNGYEPGGDGAQ